MSYYDGGSFSGQSYDRHIFEANLSTVNKMQREYWTAKQVLKKKFGKGEDQHVVASDSEIDSKLSLFESIQRTCVNLLKELERYQSCICALARDENQLGRFLKDQGSQDRTQAGKMMAAVGKSLCYSAQQRLLLRHPLGRLHQDVETFRYRAISDTIMSIDKMEEERTHYRASLLWMQDISANLDPEQYKKLEKFRKVQREVKINKDKFDRLKWAVCQKIDLLTASRSNLFSNTLVPYQDELLKFWEKTARTMAAVLESFKGYQHYEFKLLKDLNPMQELDAAVNGIIEEKQEEDGEKKEQEEQGEDALICLDESQGKEQEEEDAAAENLFKDAMEALDLNNHKGNQDSEQSLINFDNWEEIDNMADGGMSSPFDMYRAIKVQDENTTTRHVLRENQKDDPDGNLLGDFTDNGEASKEDIDLLNDILGNNEQEGSSDFEDQWKSVFGEFESGQTAEDVKSAAGNAGQENFDPLTSPGAMQPPKQSGGNQAPNYGGYLPSQLMDMHFGSYGAMPGNPAMMQQMNMQQQAMMMTQQNTMAMSKQNIVPNPPNYSTLFGQNQQQPNMGASQAGPTKKGPGQDKGNMAAWYNLFAELDPLQNPDALGKKEGDQTPNQDGGAC